MLRRRRSKRRDRLKSEERKRIDFDFDLKSKPSLLLGVLFVLCVALPHPISAAVQIDSVNATYFQKEPETSFFRPKQNGILVCQTAAVTTTVTGVPQQQAATIAWYRNGTRMNWSTSEIREKYEERPGTGTGTGTASSELHFRSFMPATHSGWYQCLVTIPTIGSVLSRPALVQLAAVEMSSGKTTRRENVTSLPGNIALIACDSPFDLSAPRSQVSFEVNGTALQLRSGKHLILSDGTLLIKQVTPIDAGNYRCVLTNREANVSQRSSVEYTLVVQPATRVNNPSLVVKSAPALRAVVGDNVTLLCVYSGNPVPSVEWELPGGSVDVSTDQNVNGRSPTVGRRTVDNKGFLHIADVSLEDAGVYRCKLAHERNTGTYSFSLQVDGPPTVALTVAPTAKGVMMRCDVTRATQSFWTFNGERVSNGDLSVRLSTTTKRIGDEMRLIIPQTTDEHRGVYQCFAENQHGTSVRSVRVDVTDSAGKQLVGATTTAPVRRRERLIVEIKNNETRNEGESVVFSCRSSANVDFFRWLFNGQPLDPNEVELDRSDSLSTLIIPHLTTNHSGPVTCYVQTRQTFDEATVYLQVLGDQRQVAQAQAQVQPERTSAAPEVQTTAQPAQKPRRGKTTTQSTLSLFPLPTQMSAKLVGRTVQLNWHIPAVDNSVPNLTESFEIQYCRDCRLGKNGQPLASAIWHTVNDTFDPQAKRYVVRGLSVGTYVFRINIRYRDGTIRSADFTRPVTIGVDAGGRNGSGGEAEDDNPIASFQVECMSERNCSVALARWTYSSSSRLLRESWDGLSIQISDTEKNLVTRKLLSGFNTTDYRLDVEPNRHLEFTISLIRNGERSASRSFVLSTYVDEDGQLSGYDTVLQQTASPTFVRVSVETVELDDGFTDGARANNNSTLPINEVQNKSIDMVYIILAATGSIVSLVVIMLIIYMVLRLRRSQRRKKTKYIPANAGALDAKNDPLPPNGVAHFGVASFSKVSYNGLPTSQSSYGQAVNGGIQHHNHSGSMTISQHSNVDESGQLLVTSNLTMITNCENPPMSLAQHQHQHQSSANFVGVALPDSANANATIRINMNPAGQRAVPLPYALPHQASPYASTNVGVSTFQKFGTLPLKPNQASRAGNLRMVTTPTATNFAGLPASCLNATDLGYYATSGANMQFDPNGAYFVSAANEYAQPILAMPHSRHPRADRSKTMRPSSYRQRDSASYSGSAAADATSTCNCGECCECTDCGSHAQTTLSVSRNRIFGQPRGNDPAAHANMQFAFALPPPPPLPNASSVAANNGTGTGTESLRKIKKPVRKKKTDANLEYSRRTRFARDDCQEFENDNQADSGGSAARGRQRDDSNCQNMSDSTHSTNRTGSEAEMVVLLGRNDKSPSSQSQSQSQPADAGATLLQNVI